MMRKTKFAATLAVTSLFFLFAAPSSPAQTLPKVSGGSAMSSLGSSVAPQDLRAQSFAGMYFTTSLSLFLAGASLPAQSQGTTRRRRTMSSQGSLLHPATLHAKAPEVFYVRFHTTKGYFTMKVTRSWAPLGADRFYNLVEHHFYDGASLFRVVPGFVVQFGLSADPRVSRAWANANIKDDPVVQSNLAGYVSFAMAGPNTRTTQVFISLGDNARLDGMGFAPFGQVIEGMDVVKQFYSGYGEHGPDQGKLTNEGKPYVEKYFPKLDSIITAHIEHMPAPAAKPSH